MLIRIVRSLVLGLLTVPVLLFATGCYEKLNGGGWMQSASGEGRATFGIHFQGYDPDRTPPYRIDASGTYHDHDASVRLGFGEVIVNASGEGPECATFSASYESQDRSRPGAGNAVLSACDRGEPGAEGDRLFIRVLSGPYAGYINEGPLLGGNFQGF